jgi:hypothetical protein
LTLEPSVYGHLVYGLAAISLDSLSTDEAGAAALTQSGDLNALDYLCIALFCKDLSTNSSSVRRIYSRLLNALQVRDELIKVFLQAEREAHERASKQINRGGVANLTKRMRKPRINVSVGV